MSELSKSGPARSVTEKHARAHERTIIQHYPMQLYPFFNTVARSILYTVG